MTRAHRSSRSTSTAPTTRRPRGRRAALAAARRRDASCSSARPREIGDAPDGVEVVDAPVSIAKDRRSRPRRRARPRTPRSSRPPARSPTAAPTRSSPAARPAPRSPPACSTSSARKGIHRPALALPAAGPGRPGHAARRRRQRRRAGPSTSSSSRSWARRSRRRCSASSARASACSRTGPSRRRAATRSSRRTRALAGRGGLDFVGNVEGFALTEGVADVIVTDGFTGNVDAEGRSRASRRR